MRGAGLCRRWWTRETPELTHAAEPGLAGFFDLGFSFGLADEALQADARRTDGSIGLVGISNPLGNGVTVDLLTTRTDLIATWLEHALRQVSRPEIDTGQAVADNRGRQRLTAFIRRNPIESCTLAVYPLGTCYLRVRFPRATDHRLIAGLLTAYEYAAYRPEISEALLAASRSAIAAATSADVTRSFVAMTARPTGGRRRDATGYEQSELISAFSRVLRLDPGDVDPAITAFWNVDRQRLIDFEYHGLMYYSWPTCLLVPHGRQPWAPSQELARVEDCILIAHVASGACEALLRLCEDEIKKQMESLIARKKTVRGSRELNRLRTFSLAVVTLTDLRRVTVCDEDQTYFRWFAEDAGLQRSQQLITESVELLYNVQDAEVQREHSARELLLNGVLAVLASLTLVSVSADAYNFISGASSMIGRRAERIHLLTGFLAVIVVLTTVLLWVLTRPLRRPRKGPG